MESIRKEGKRKKNEGKINAKSAAFDDDDDGDCNSNGASMWVSEEQETS